MRNLLVLLLIAAATPAFAATNTDDADATWTRWGKSKVRWLVTGSTDGTDDRFGIHADRDWATAPEKTRRIVLVHGFNAAPASMKPIADALRRRGHPCAMASYPNDQSIDRSAKRLADELRPIIRSARGAPIAVVTHSMGGLVARRVLEDPQLDPGGIDRLVMVAPPNHGSNLARLAIGTDVYEHAWLRSDDRKIGFFHSVDDGMGEATHDLRPGSPFLDRLNARPRNPRVAYTIILGDRGRFSDQQLERLRSSFESAAAKRRTLAWLPPKLNDCLEQCDEVLVGRGDGAVAVRRGRLAGVEDVHILPGTHDMIDLRGEAGEQLKTLIAERL